MRQFEVQIGGGRCFIKGTFEDELDAQIWAEKAHTQWMAFFKTVAMTTPIKEAVMFVNDKHEQIAVNGKIQDEATTQVAPPEAPPASIPPLKPICERCGRPNYVKVSKSPKNPGRYYETCSTGVGDNTCKIDWETYWRDDVPRQEQ